MKRIAFILTLAFCLSCNDESINCDPQTAWVDKMIRIGGDDTGKYISVYSYQYKGKTVFLFKYELKCCDFFTAQLFDNKGNSLCFPYGGITGQGDKKCEDFDLTKKNEALYWEIGK
jgi:hypothetical protein